MPAEAGISLGMSGSESCLSAVRSHPGVVRSGLRPVHAIGVAAAHAGVIAILCLTSRPRTPPPDFTAAVIFVVQPAPADVPQVLAAAVLTPVSVTQTADLAALPRLSLAADPHALPSASPRAQIRTEMRTAARPIGARPSETASAAAPAPRLQPAIAAAPVASVATQAATASQSDALQGWKIRLRQAIQNAVIYPAMARMTHRQGSAAVRFDYRNGAAAHASLSRSSTQAALDAAAVDAVNRATLPPPPHDLDAATRSLVVEVNFRLDPAG